MMMRDSEKGLDDSGNSAEIPTDKQDTWKTRPLVCCGYCCLGIGLMLMLVYCVLSVGEIELMSVCSSRRYSQDYLRASPQRRHEQEKDGNLVKDVVEKLCWIIADGESATGGESGLAGRESNHSQDGMIHAHDIDASDPRITQILMSNNKFLVFHPFEGFNNQKIMLYRALKIARILNRTCIIPPVYKHTTGGPIGSYVLDEADFLPADAIYDLDIMGKYTPVMSLPFNIRDFERAEQSPFTVQKEYPPQSQIFQTPKWYVDYQPRDHVQQHPMHIDQVADTYGHVQQKYLFLAGHFLWQAFASTTSQVFTFADALKHVRFNKNVQDIAVDIIRNTPVLNTGNRTFNYNAIHARQGDAKLTFSGFPFRFPDDYFSLHTRASNFLSTSSVLYVATEPGTPQVEPFRKLRMDFKLVFSADLDQHSVLRFDRMFDLPRQQGLRDDVFGIVEQIICARARQFVGTNGSTFSNMITKMRQDMARARSTDSDAGEHEA